MNYRKSVDSWIEGKRGQTAMCETTIEVQDTAGGGMAVQLSTPTVQRQLLLPTDDNYFSPSVSA